MIDPVCGMDVKGSPPPPSSEYKGRSYYFCSLGCKARFEAQPERYLGSADIAAAGRDDAGLRIEMPHPSSDAKSSGPPEPVDLIAETAAGGTSGGVEYTCPMHPEILRQAPGSCPICGMALELRTFSSGQSEANPELTDMSRRFWVSSGFTLPILIAGMSGMWPMRMALASWVEFALATPVVLWGGWPFFQRFWWSIINRSPNMFTLIGAGTGAAYFYSVVATVIPEIFPVGFQLPGGTVPLYFEAAAVITTLVLLGQVLELRARAKTSGAIRSLLGLAPKSARLVRGDGRKSISLWLKLSRETSCVFVLANIFPRTE